MTIDARNDPAPVRCISSHTYPDRPISVYWDGTWHRVDAIQRRWREEDGEHFILRVEDGRVFSAHYQPADDRWHLELVAQR